MKKYSAFLIVALILFFFIALLMFIFGGTYNKLVELQQNVEEKWAQVENVLQRRFDLIPNLVEVVKKYAVHEKEIFVKVAEARAKLAGAKTTTEKVKASQELGGFLSRLLVIVENYPNLKANTVFINLQAQLEGTENRITVERKRYNEAVKEYNTTRNKFPTVFIAGFFGFERLKPYFKASEEAQKVPKVEL
ncbi:LemA family protein [Candidatus Margulisiibacteriota bacterium]